MDRQTEKWCCLCLSQALAWQKQRQTNTNHAASICRWDWVASLTWSDAVPWPTADLASCTAPPWSGWLSPVGLSSRTVAHQQALCTGQNRGRICPSQDHVPSHWQPHCNHASLTVHHSSCYTKIALSHLGVAPLSWPQNSVIFYMTFNDLYLYFQAFISPTLMQTVHVISNICSVQRCADINFLNPYPIRICNELSVSYPTFRIRYDSFSCVQSTGMIEANWMWNDSHWWPGCHRPFILYSMPVGIIK